MLHNGNIGFFNHNTTHADEKARNSDVVITMVPNSPNVRAAVLGGNGVLEGAKEGLYIIDKKRSRRIGRSGGSLLPFLFFAAFEEMEDLCGSHAFQAEVLCVAAFRVEIPLIDC